MRMLSILLAPTFSHVKVSFLNCHPADTCMSQIYVILVIDFQKGSIYLDIGLQYKNAGFKSGLIQKTITYFKIKKEKLFFQ